MPIQFTNPDVAAKYVATFEVDKKITIQGVYWGMLSEITPEGAAKLVALQDNQISLKKPSKQTDTVPLPESK